MTLNLLGLKIFRIAIFCLTPFICDIAFAQGARLFTYLNPPKAQALGGKESSRLSQIKSHRLTASVNFIQIDAAALNNNILQITLPDGTQRTLVNSLRESTAPGTKSWVGRTSDGSAEGSFTVHQGTLFGKISTGGNQYAIESYGNNAYVLVQLDLGKLPPEHESDSRSEQKKIPAQISSSKIDATAVTRAYNPITIDILVAYTPNARAATFGLPEARIRDAVSILNDALSQIDLASVRVNIVDIFEIPLNDVGSSLEAMIRVFSSSDMVRSRQKSSGADLMMLITGDARTICGKTLEVGPNASSAYAVVNAECMMYGISFSHEFGHLLGARHEVGVDNAGPFYAHAYVKTLPNGVGCLRTIVSSGDSKESTESSPGCSRNWRYNVFSNPRRTVTIAATNFRTGSESADNARMIAESAQIVANFNGAGSAAEQAAKAAKARSMRSWVTSLILSVFQP